MLKLIVADDETLFLKYMSTSIDWKACGYELTNTAGNGREALELIEAEKPDVVLVDIDMPYLNGLELAKVLKDRFTDIVVILITGYSEFEYAQKAVKAGVEDYILKPFDHSELTATLLKVRERIGNRKEEKEFMRANRDMLKERLLNLLISDEYPYEEDEIIRHLERFGIYIPSLNFLVASIQIEGLYENCPELRDIGKCKTEVSRLLNNYVAANGQHMVFNGTGGRIQSIISFENRCAAEKFSACEYERFCRITEGRLNLKVTVGMGSAVNGFANIRRSYMESAVALQNKVILGGGKVIEYSKLERECMNIGYYPSKINENLSVCLHLNDIEGARRHIDEVFLFIEEKKLSVDFTYTILFGLVSLCLSFIKESGKNIGDIFGRSFSPYSEIKSRPSLSSTKEWITGIFEITIKYCTENRLTRSKKLMDTVIKQIEASYFDPDLTVEGIAKNAYINSCYLRKVFKKELNMTASDYITGVRMAKAKQFIESNNFKISCISEMAGYRDSNYFSKCFKKYYGISPSEYECSIR